MNNLLSWVHPGFSVCVGPPVPSSGTLAAPFPVSLLIPPGFLLPIRIEMLMKDYFF
jgi:hypothetical protein